MKRIGLLGLLGLSGLLATSASFAQTTHSPAASPGLPAPARIEPAQEIGHAPPSASTQQAGIRSESARAWAEAAQVAGQAPAPAHQRRRIVRGKPLPSDVKFQRPPAEMLLKLPVYKGFEWRMVGWDLVLIRQTSAVVHDIVFDVFK